MSIHTDAHSWLTRNHQLILHRPINSLSTVWSESNGSPIVFQHAFPPRRSFFFRWLLSVLQTLQTRHLFMTSPHDTKYPRVNFSLVVINLIGTWSWYWKIRCIIPLISSHSDWTFFTHVEITWNISILPKSRWWLWCFCFFVFINKPLKCSIIYLLFMFFFKLLECTGL